MQKIFLTFVFIIYSRRAVIRNKLSCKQCLFSLVNYISVLMLILQAMLEKNTKYITGIHHITALASDARENVTFYSGVLGLRMIKQTVNFDDPGVYHLYYGDEKGTPGSILTFFPYPGIRKGMHGTGQVTVTTFSLPLHSVGFWENRLKRFRVPFEKARERLESEVFIGLQDPEGLRLELMFNDRDDRLPYQGGPVPAEYAIRGFFGAEICADRPERTATLLTGKMDHRLIAENGYRTRFAALDKPGNYIDILAAPSSVAGKSGHGTIHHIAFSTPGQITQNKLREAIQDFNLHPTPVIDRQYFKSIYFRENGGVLFEIATEGPGFMIDEPIDALGQHLKLPPQYEYRRKEIEALLAPIDMDIKSYR